MSSLASAVENVQETQKKYWSKLIENLDFFNETEITFDKIQFIREHVHCYNGYYNHFLDKAEHALKIDKLNFCHFWLSHYLQYAVMSCWCDYFNYNRSRGLKERNFSKIADKESEFFKEYLLGLFP